MACLQASPLGSVHHHDEFGPVQLFGRQRYFGIICQAGGINLQIWPRAEYPLGGGTALAVATAQKQQAAWRHQMDARYSSLSRT